MKKRKTYEISVIDRTYSKTISDETKFYTSDTALELRFELKETEYNFESAEIVLLNIDDRSLVTRTVTKSSDSFTYELDDDIIAHYGEWRGQVRFEQEGEIYVSSPVKFRIENDLSNERPPQLSDVQSWVSLKRYADSLTEELKQAVLSVEGIEDTFNINELARQTTFETNESERESVFEINESARQTNEQARESAESVRVSNEEERELNEAERISKDSERDSKIEEVEGLQAEFSAHKEDYANYLDSELDFILKELPNGAKDEIIVSGGKAKHIKINQKYVLEASDIVRYLDNYKSVGLVRILKPTLIGWNQIGKDSTNGGVDTAHLIEDYPAKNTSSSSFDDTVNVNTSTVRVGADFLDIIVAKGRFANLVEARNYFIGKELIYQLEQPITTQLLLDDLSPNTHQIVKLSSDVKKLTDAIIALGGMI